MKKNKNKLTWNQWLIKTKLRILNYNSFEYNKLKEAWKNGEDPLDYFNAGPINVRSSIRNNIKLKDFLEQIKLADQVLAEIIYEEQAVIVRAYYTNICPKCGNQVIRNEFNRIKCINQNYTNNSKCDFIFSGTILT